MFFMRKMHAIPRRSVRLSILLFALVCLFSACGGSSLSVKQSTPSTQRNPVSTAGTAVPAYTADSGVAASIPVGTDPNIAVESGNATQLTFVGSDTTSVSTDLYAFPYKKEGNTIVINFGQTIAQALTISMPRQANLTVTLSDGNVTIDTIQGQVSVTLASGTVQIKNFTPRKTDTIETRSGSISVTFTHDASFTLKAQTNFGAIVSGYSAISEKRSGMQASASGTVNKGSAATVSLSVGYGSITLGPA